LDDVARWLEEKPAKEKARMVGGQQLEQFKFL
jgi:hypothetical protein